MPKHPTVQQFAAQIAPTIQAAMEADKAGYVADAGPWYARWGVKTAWPIAMRWVRRLTETALRALAETLHKMTVGDLFGMLGDWSQEPGTKAMYASLAHPVMMATAGDEVDPGERLAAINHELNVLRAIDAADPGADKLVLEALHLVGLDEIADNYATCRSVRDASISR